MIAASVRPAVAVPLVASCALHLALLGVVAGLLPHWVARAPAVLEAELIEPERPTAPREPERPAPRPAAPRPTALPRLIEAPRPIAPPVTPMPSTPMPPPPIAATAPPAPIAPAAAPAPLAAAAPATPQRETFALAPTEPAGTNAELPAGAAKSMPPPPPQAKVSPDAGITRTATPSGGYQVRPSYPSSARRLGIEGTSLLRVYVAADGRVTEVEVDESAGHPDLDRAAVDAVRRWKFEPGRRGSEAIGMWVRLPVQFVLR